MSPRRPREKASAHLAWIRTLPSLVAGTGPVEAAHVRYADLRYFKRSTGMAEKPHDKFTVPLAAEAHREQHQSGERDWWHSKGIDPVLIAALLWLHTGDSEAAEHIIATARSISR